MESLPEFSDPGSVVVEIGGEVGAATVVVPAALADLEIEIRAVGDEWAGQHVAVIRRRLPAGDIWAAFFPGLVQGGYEVRVRGSNAAGPVEPFEVAGGRVTTVDWDVDPEAAGLPSRPHDHAHPHDHSHPHEHHPHDE